MSPRSIALPFAAFLVICGSVSQAVVVQTYDSTLNSLPSEQGWAHFEIDSTGTIAGGDANMELVDLGGSDGVVLHVKDQLTATAFDLPTFFYDATPAQKELLYFEGFRLAFQAKNLGGWFVGFGFNDSIFELANNIGLDQRIGFGVGAAPIDGNFHDFEVLGSLDVDTGNYNFTLSVDGGSPSPLNIGNNTSATQFQSSLHFSSGSGGGTAADAQFRSIILESRDLAPALPVLVINRDTGEISLENNTSSAISGIIGYSLLSNAGSLDQAFWNRQASGSQLINDNDDWTVLTGVDVSTDLSEAVLITSGDGNGGNLSAGTGSLSFGDVWRKTPFEDIALELLLDDGTTLATSAGQIVISYTGNPVLLGDIAGATIGDVPNGTIDLVDWRKLRSLMGSDLSDELPAEAYYGGDLNGDGLVNYKDYHLFVAAFDAANPLTSFATAIAAIPEPASFTLMACWMVFSLRYGRNRRSSSMILTVSDSQPRSTNSPRRGWPGGLSSSLTVLALLLVGLATNSAHAVSNYAIANYSADAGNPANAAAIQSPMDQGMFEFGSTIQGQTHDPELIIQEGVVIGGVNAFRNLDNGPTNPGFGAFLTPEALQAMYDFGWKYTLTGVVNQGGQFTAWGVGADNPWGLPEFARIGITYNSTGDTWNVGPFGTGGVVQAIGSIGTSFAHAELTGAPRSTTATFEVFSFDSNGVGPQIGPTQNLTGFGTGNATNANVLGIQSGSSPGVGREGIYNAISLVVPAPDTLTLEVNTASGLVKLINNSASDVSFNGYFIDSPGAQLNSLGWASLQSVDHDGNDIPDDGIGWEEFDAASANFLGEGFLTGATTLSPGQFLSLGTAYNPTVAGIGNDGDLSFTLTDALGRTVLSELFSTVEYVSSAAMDGDFDGDSDVDGRDFLLWQRGLSPNPLSSSDLAAWRSNYGEGSLTATLQAVPEPTAGLLTIVGFIIVAGSARHFPVAKARLSLACCSSTPYLSPVLAFLLALLLGGVAQAVQNDRDYTLGDDPAEPSNPNVSVGSSTYDSAGSPGAGNLQDLLVAGSPIYRPVDGSNGRPGAQAGDLGIEFDGIDDVLYTPISMNAPAQMYNNTTFFPGPPPQIFPHNYAGIFAHGIQLWAKPTLTSTRQDLVFDSRQHGIGITADNTWGLSFDSPAGGLLDSEVEVASTVDDNGWVHVMQLAGFNDPHRGRSAQFGVLLVNGVAVRAAGGFYDPATTPLSLGASVTLDGAGSITTTENHYTGVLDDVRIFFWGDNSDELGDDGIVGGTNTGVGALNADGQDWGSLNLATDNDWIAQELNSLGVTNAADVNLSGGAPDNADVTAFLTHWRKEQRVNNIRVGDWNSRQQGDLNFDGIVDLRDALILHEGLQDAGLGGLNFALLGTTVPEPSTAVMSLLGLSSFLARARFRRHSRSN